jgi:hypothetical protein
MSQLKLSLHDGWTGYCLALKINALGQKKTPKLPLKTQKKPKKPSNFFITRLPSQISLS